MGETQKNNKMSGANGHLNGSYANYKSPPLGAFRAKGQQGSDKSQCFKMPLHYPRFKKSDYETMHEWQLDRLLSEYGLPVTGDLACKRKFAIGAFLWPSEAK